MVAPPARKWKSDRGRFGSSNLGKVGNEELNWCLVLGAWCLVLGSWCLVLGSWFLVLGRYWIPSIKHQALSSFFILHSSFSILHSSFFILHSQFFILLPGVIFGFDSAVKAFNVDRYPDVLPFTDFFGSIVGFNGKCDRSF